MAKLSILEEPGTALHHGCSLNFQPSSATLQHWLKELGRCCVWLPSTHKHSGLSAPSLFSGSHRPHKALSPVLAGVLTILPLSCVSPLLLVFGQREPLRNLQGGCSFSTTQQPLYCVPCFRACGVLGGCMVTVIHSQVQQVNLPLNI